MAVVGQVTHVRCKVMYRCVCARHCAVETDTQQGNQQRALKKQNLGSYSVQHNSFHRCTTTGVQPHRIRFFGPGELIQNGFSAAR